MPQPRKPEEKARDVIDRALHDAGWDVQNRDDLNLSAARGVAVREFKMRQGHGFADYLLFVDGEAVGALEAKREGHTLSGVEAQARKYSDGLPANLRTPVRPLPFLYTSNGVETHFLNRLDPKPRSRELFAPHRPETLAEWLAADPLRRWKAQFTLRDHAADELPAGEAYGDRPASLRARMQALPRVQIPHLWPNQLEAIGKLESSLKANHPRALLQMATGSGKTITAIAQLYRLIKFAGARRVLFLVDRNNLGEQAETEFETYRTYDDNRKFTELYKVQRLTGTTIGAASKVVVATVQRLYSMLQGKELPPDADEVSAFELEQDGDHEPVTVAYNPALPPETFDVIVIDECHRSIYTRWRQVLEYFDSFLIGLTATPAAHTFAFFNRNLVTSYDHGRAVADRVNVDYEIFKIRTHVTTHGHTIEAGREAPIQLRDRRTHVDRWKQPDQDMHFRPSQLDEAVVVPDQIRLILRTFRERLFTELFPGRTYVPKTLIFAKSDEHAEEIVKHVREVFAEEDRFCTKITYKVTGQSPRSLIQEFRNLMYPRIAVTVDMIATGTDIKPVEIVMFMRSVGSRLLFEQMKGRGVRVIDPQLLQAVTPDAVAKTHFVVVDCVGVTERQLSDTSPLDRNPSVPTKTLLEEVAKLSTDPDHYASLASRLTRLDRRCTESDRTSIAAASGGRSLQDLAAALLHALDLDEQVDAARKHFKLGPDAQPTDAQLDAIQVARVREAAAPLATNPDLRRRILALYERNDQVIDPNALDQLLEAGPGQDPAARARETVASFEQFLQDNRDKIDALRAFFSQPYRRRLRHADIKALAQAIQSPPHPWTPAQLWECYAQLDRDRVRGAGGQRLLTDIVSLVRFALHQDGELVPFPDQVQARFANWLAQQANRGRTFTPEQTTWLERIRDHIASSLMIDMEDFDYTPFIEMGGPGRAKREFGKELPELLHELNEALSA